MRAWFAVILLGSACDGRPPPEDAGPTCEHAPATSPPISDPGSGLAGIDRTPDPSCAGTWVAGVQGRIEDSTGAGVSGARTQLCVAISPSMTLVCLAAPTTDPAGDFAVGVVEAGTRCVTRATMRILLPGTPNAATYCRIALTPTDSVLDVTEPIPLFETLPNDCLPPMGDPEAPRTIALGDGLELVDLRPSQIARYPELAAAAHDLTGSCVLNSAPAGGFLGAFGFRVETDVAGGVAIRIPNATGLAVGTRVDLYVQGGLDTMLIDGTPVEEGAWVRYGTGTVGAGGATIASDPGSLLPVLNWVAYRLPP